MTNDFSFEDDIQNVERDNASDLNKVSELLMDDRFKRRKTIIDERQISSLTTLDTIGMIYDIEFINNWIPSYLEYRTSKGGEGRKQIVDIAQSMMNRNQERFDNVLEVLGKR